ncbi:MAG: hypothetical protein K2X77_03165 [Candidatus Obscuribacterales bacterium]|jgi:hypothetical protein|nr:hypothetical protein [Candidatus Obscuribacterales bacterium]
MSKKLIAGITLSLSVVVMAATVKAEADAINAPAQGLAAHGCSMVEEFADGTQVIKTKKGVLLKFLPNGLVIRKKDKAQEAGTHAGCLSSLINLSKH